MVDQAENYLLVQKSLHHIRVYKTEILLTICQSAKTSAGVPLQVLNTGFQDTNGSAKERFSSAEKDDLRSLSIYEEYNLETRSWEIVFKQQTCREEGNKLPTTSSVQIKVMKTHKQTNNNNDDKKKKATKKREALNFFQRSFSLHLEAFEN